MVTDSTYKRKVAYILATFVFIVIQIFLIYKTATDTDYNNVIAYNFFINLIWIILAYLVIRTFVILLDKYAIFKTIDEIISDAVELILGIIHKIGEGISSAIQGLGNNRQVRYQPPRKNPPRDTTRIIIYPPRPDTSSTKQYKPLKKPKKPWPPDDDPPGWG